MEQEIKEVATLYLSDELGRDDAKVVGVVRNGDEALVLVRAVLGDFALHLTHFSGPWTVVDELDDSDYYGNGGQKVA